MFTAGRAGVLRELVAKPRLFHTAHGIAEWEEAARRERGAGAVSPGRLSCAADARPPPAPRPAEPTDELAELTGRAPSATTSSYLSAGTS